MKSFLYTLLAIALLLVVVELSVPPIAKWKVNQVLNDLPEYAGRVDDIDIAWLEVGLIVEGFYLDKKQQQDSIPFASIDALHLNIDFSALLRGKVLADVRVHQPVMNFIVADDSTDQQLGGDYLWFEPLTELRPMEVNQLLIEDGTIHFRKLDEDPKVDLVMSSLEAEVRNLRNVIHQDSSLPSFVHLHAVLLDSGDLSIHSDMNIMKEVPDADIDFKLENMPVTKLNDLFQAYLPYTMSNGTFSAYSELVVSNQNIEGYMKPIFDDLEVTHPSEERGPIQAVAETVVQGTIDLFENNKKQQLASKVPLKGTVESQEVGILRAVVNVFINGFIEAFSREIEHTVEYPVDGK